METTTIKVKYSTDGIVKYCNEMEQEGWAVRSVNHFPESTWAIIVCERAKTVYTPLYSEG
jgi:hypothetical protein